MNEAETRAELIDPALAAAGWGVVDASRARREMIAPGRLTGSGKDTERTIIGKRWANAGPARSIVDHFLERASPCCLGESK